MRGILTFSRGEGENNGFKSWLNCQFVLINQDDSLGDKTLFSKLLTDSNETANIIRNPEYVNDRQGIETYMNDLMKLLYSSFTRQSCIKDLTLRITVNSYT